MKISIIYNDNTESDIDNGIIDIKHRCVYSLSSNGWVCDVIPFENIFIASYKNNETD